MSRPERRRAALGSIRGAILTLCAAVLLAPGLVYGETGKLSLMIGGFRLAASTSSETGEVTALGAYRVAYHHPVSSRLELNLGYTLLMSGTIGGDLGFGFDFGISWFPVTPAGSTTTRGDGGILVVAPHWRPYVSVLFLQRNFQSVQTGYAGFGGAIGAERTLGPSTHLRLEARGGSLRGSATATATELIGWGGMGFAF